MGMRRRGGVSTGGLRAAAACVVIGGSTLAACGDPEDVSLCVAYAEYLAVVEPVLTADPTGATAGEAFDAVDDLLAEATQLAAVANGQYHDLAADVVQALTDLELTLAGAPSDADYATWEPLVADSIEVATDAHERLSDALDTECAPAEL